MVEKAKIKKETRETKLNKYNGKKHSWYSLKMESGYNYTQHQAEGTRKLLNVHCLRN